MERKIIITHNSQTNKSTFECPIVYKNFWSSKVLNSLNKKIEKSPEEHKNGSNRVQWSTEKWHHSITLDSGPILIIDLAEDKEIITNIKKELDVIYDTCTFRYFYCAIHMFLAGAYVPIHDDSPYDFITTTYLNQEQWDVNWGGALIYTDQQHDISVQFPEYNKMVVQSGDFNSEKSMKHMTSILSKSSPPRVSMQIFASENPEPFKMPWRPEEEESDSSKFSDPYGSVSQTHHWHLAGAGGHAHSKK